MVSMVNCTPGSGISTMMSYIWTVASWSSCACLWSIFNSRVYFSIKYSLSFSHPLHSSIGLCKTLMFLVMSGNWRSVWSLICGGFHIYCFSFCYTWCHYQVSVAYCFSGQAREVPLPKSVYTDCQLSYRNQSSRVHKPYEQKQGTSWGAMQISVIHRIYSPSTQTSSGNLSSLLHANHQPLSPHSPFLWAILFQPLLSLTFPTKVTWLKVKVIQKRREGPLDPSFSKHTMHENYLKCLFTCVSCSVSFCGSQKFAGRALDIF